MKYIQNYEFDPIQDQFDSTGSYGALYRGKDRQNDNIRVAIKTINVSVQNMAPALFSQLLRQYQLVKSVKGQGVVKSLTFGTIQWATNRKKYAIVQQLMDGNLQTLFRTTIEGRDAPKLTQEQAQSWIKKIVICYEDIYKAGIIHRDLKPNNILFKHAQNGGSQVFKICDFGFVTFDNSCSMDPNIGTIGFRAPEVMTSKYYSYKVDLFSIGCILFYFLSGNTLQGLQIMRINNQYKVNQGLLGQRLNNMQISQDAKDFMKRCLKNQVSQRFEWDALKNHIFIRTRSELMAEQAQKKVSQLFDNHYITSKQMHIYNRQVELTLIPQLVRRLNLTTFALTIRHILLDGNNIRSEGIRLLFPPQSQRFPLLQQLYLDNCQLGDQGVRNLSMHTFSSLYDLDIRRNNISSGIKHLFKADKFPRLEAIDLTNNNITTQVITQIRAQNVQFHNRGALVGIFDRNPIQKSQQSINLLQSIFIQANLH